jgi:hypothetical protein
MRKEYWPPQLVVARYTDKEPIANYHSLEPSYNHTEYQPPYYYGYRPKDAWRKIFTYSDLRYTIIEEMLGLCVSFEELDEILNEFESVAFSYYRMSWTPVVAQISTRGPGLYCIRVARDGSTSGYSRQALQLRNQKISLRQGKP